MANSTSTPVPSTPPKGHSPSKNIQRGVDTAWDSQKGYKTPAQAIADQHNKKPVSGGGQK